MNDRHTKTEVLSDVAVIIPALNEAENLAELLPRLRSLAPGQTIVCDNGSTDETRSAAEACQVQWVYEPRRGYGAACYAGLRCLAPPIRVVAFMDADVGDGAAFLPALVQPILDDQCDLVLGTRVSKWREPGAATLPQRLGNRLVPLLIKWGWGHDYTDMGPFRAVRRTALEAMRLEDRAYGWTVEMQIRAVELGLRIREIPVPHRKRKTGRSKISGSVRGVLLAGYGIVRTCAACWLTKHRRVLVTQRNPLE